MWSFVSCISLIAIIVFNTEAKLSFEQFQTNQNNHTYVDTKDQDQILFNNSLFNINTKNLSESENYNDLENHSKSNFELREICRTTFKKFNHITILSLDSEFSTPINVFKEFGQVIWYSEFDNFIPSTAIIIEIKSFNEFYELIDHKPQLWNQKSSYVIVVLECSLDIKMGMEYLWQRHQIYKYVLVCGHLNPKLYIYRPYLPEERSHVFDVMDLNDIANNIAHAVNDLYGEKLRVAIFPLVPYSIFLGGKFVGGIDFLSLGVFQQRMNFTPVILRPSDGLTFPEPDNKVVGSIREILNDNADIALNGHFLQDYGIKEIMMSHVMYMDKLCFIVAPPSFKSHYAVIVHIFSAKVWIMLSVTYFVTVLVYYAVEQLLKPKHKRQFTVLLLHVYSTIVLGGSVLKAKRLSHRFLLGAVLLGVLIINNSFQGCLTTVLSNPVRNPPINTLKEIAMSDLFLESDHAENLVADEEMIQLLRQLRKNKQKDDNYIRLGRFPLLNIQNYNNYLFYRDDLNITEYLHTVPECIKSNYLSFVVRENSPLLQRMNVFVQRFQENGLIYKWFGGETALLLRKLFWPLENEKLTKSQAKAFKITDLAFSFNLLLLGLTTSAAVFLVENILGHKKKQLKCIYDCFNTSLSRTQR